jgi:hypothetical protein
MRAPCRAFSPFSALRRTPVPLLSFPRNDGVGSSSLPVGSRDLQGFLVAMALLGRISVVTTHGEERWHRVSCGLELGPLPEIRLDRPRLLDALAKGGRVDGGEAVKLRLDLFEVAA